MATARKFELLKLNENSPSVPVEPGLQILSEVFGPLSNFCYALGNIEFQKNYVKTLLFVPDVHCL
jgi:hypothetical protein